MIGKFHVRIYIYFNVSISLISHLTPKHGCSEPVKINHHCLHLLSIVLVCCASFDKHVFPSTLKQKRIP